MEPRDLNGKKFADLDKNLQKKFLKGLIRTITIQRESNKDLRFEIFERLNTGSVSLNDQELRNCIYRGAYNHLLRELAAGPEFMSLLGIQKPEKRMRDIELVLRFAAFFHATHGGYRPPMRRFLNGEMERYQSISEVEKDKLRQAFKHSTQIILRVFDKKAFKRFRRGTERDSNGAWENNRFNASLFDILMNGFVYYAPGKIVGNEDAIREGLIWLMTRNDEFIDAIERSTSSGRAVEIRFNKWLQVLKEVMEGRGTQPGAFTLAKKMNLFNKNTNCSICGRQIINIDDAAVDGDKYFLKDVPEKAALQHRFCDWSQQLQIMGPGPGKENKLKLKIRVNWQMADRPLATEVLCENASSQTVVKLIGRLIEVYGIQILDRIANYRISRGPMVSRNPGRDFRNKRTGKIFTNHVMPNTGYYVLTHSDNTQKNKDLKGLLHHFNMPSDMFLIEEVPK